MKCKLVLGDTNKNLSECMTNLINSEEKIQTCHLPWDISTPKPLKQCSRKQYAMKGSNMSVFAVSFLEQSTAAYKQCPGLKLYPILLIIKDTEKYYFLRYLL